MGNETRAIWARQMQETGAFPVRATEIHAWEEGTVGWAGVKETIDWEGRTFESRATYVLHLEHGEWKVVHVHWSFPRANVETLGRPLTVSLDELERTLQLTKPDLSESFAVDGTVTIVFTDIVDSTVMLSRLGDPAWVDVIRLHNAVIEEVTTAHRGTVVEKQGDGSMLAFSSARRAVACAQAIQQEIERCLRRPVTPDPGKDRHPYRRRHEGGRAFLRHDRALRGARRQPCLGGEVLVSSTVHELLVESTPGVVFVGGREVELKGIAGRHRLYALAPA